ncbi:hypothetical protein Caka_2894 [Coraliomargarita akajimensis DSM 45221]|uniref:Uncharacterized protein n=1 Tax=Coraliomargarita akajimensis (strain DSM 45221 / IAM 15411 / JCM 23193 / KCTC 12865 / 04OKA010-24) TaxID=583355 RepID=D5ER63_CORAD|nr:hypothetical protein Caka_2894 [Coraliomargarita akajimensis DSM 45221]
MKSDKYAYLQRGKRRERIFTAGLRIFCAVISALLIFAFIYFFSNGGINEIRENKDFREYALKIGIGLL